MASFFGSQRVVSGGTSSLPLTGTAGPGMGSIRYGPVMGGPGPTFATGGAMRGGTATYVGAPPPGVRQSDGCCSLRNCMCALLVFLSLVLVTGAIYLVMLPDQTKYEDEDVRVQHANETLFDCFHDYWDYQNAWTEPQKEYCCKKENRGCERHAEKKYNCFTGFLSQWDHKQKDWCCSKYGVCPRDHYSHSQTYDCRAGHSNAEQGWSAAKKHWCCEREGAGCPERDRLPYDCNAGFANWEKGWSKSKKTWCCDHAEKGCDKPQPEEYDCAAGFTNWQKGWSHDKKTWCCNHKSVGCEDPYDCKAGFSNWQKGWSMGKKDFCCRKHQLGCAVSTAADLYDCRADFLNWQTKWTREKVSWCCAEKNVACKARAQNVTQDVEPVTKTIAGVPVHLQKTSTTEASTTEEKPAEVSTTEASTTGAKTEASTTEEKPAEASTTIATVAATAPPSTTIATKAATTLAGSTTTTPTIEPHNHTGVIVMGGR